MAYEIKVIDKAVRVLQCFTHQERQFTLNQLVLKSQINKPTLIRLLNSLIQNRLIVKDEHRRTYMLGPMAWRLGQIYHQNDQAEILIRPLLKKLSLQIRQTITFSICEGHQEVCLYCYNSNRELNHHITEGDVFDLLTASGKVFLAMANSKSSYYQKLQKQGYLFSLDERIQNLAVIAVPIFNSKKVFCGVLSASGFKQYFTERNLTKIINALLAQQKDIQDKLNFPINLHYE